MVEVLILIIGVTALSDYKKYVDAFGKRMLAKLEKNRHKGEWKDLSFDRAFELMQQEIKELEDEINFIVEYDGDIDITNITDIINEAADVANFALMIASVALRSIGKDLPEVVDGEADAISNDSGPIREA